MYPNDMEMLEDIQAFDKAKEAIAQGEELVPSAIVDALLEGENPIAVWRVYRGVSQQELAGKAGLSLDVLAELEAGHLNSDEIVLSRLAKALNLTIEDISL